MVCYIMKDDKTRKKDTNGKENSLEKDMIEWNQELYLEAKSIVNIFR